MMIEPTNKHTQQQTHTTNTQYTPHTKAKPKPKELLFVCMRNIVLKRER